MARWVGLHLNGWQDHAARDWDMEDHDQRIDPPLTVDGGIGSDAVTMPPPRQAEVGELGHWLETRSRWIAGPQATNSPVGRGPGWGDIGEPRLRLALRDALARLQAGPDEIAARAVRGGATALAPHAERLMMAVPDLPEFAEAAQGRMLAALRRPRGPRALLLWRSVAAFLGLLSRGVIAPDRLGLRVRLLVHDAQGFELQELVLAQMPEHQGHVAPERNGYGRRVLPQLGLAQLLARVEDAYFTRSPDLRQRIEASRVPLVALLDPQGPAETEILRRHNGTWHENRLTASVPDLPDTGAGLPGAGTADLTVLLTPLAGPARVALLERMRQLLPELVVGDWGDIAQGALLAGRLVERGLPHYFDRLEPIALAVLRNDVPDFVPLVEAGVVPANREYVSPVLKGFRWAAGKSRIEFYVRKGASEIRAWVAEAAETPSAPASVELQLRQTPGQSWALLQAGSPDWAPLAEAPLHLDWETLIPDPRSEAEILESLRRPEPGYPHRVREPACIGFWDGSVQGSALLEVLRSGRGDIYAELHRSARQRMPGDGLVGSGPRMHPVSTDGELPDELAPEDVARFDAAMNRLLDRHLAVEKDAARPMENRPFLALTWTFGRCPRALQLRIVEALEAAVLGRHDPLHAMTSAQKILQQGGGRAVTDPALLGRLIEALAMRPAPNTDTRGALSFVLSRRNGIGAALDEGLVRRIATGLRRALAQLLQERRFGQDFAYCIGAVAGLLRYREVSPWALTTGVWPEAEGLHALLAEIREVMPITTKRDRDLTEILGVLMEFLAGTGGDPDVLVRIDEL